MAFAGLNYFAVVVAAVASWLFGAGYYMALAGPWMAALGKTKAALKGPTGRPSPVPFVLSFVAELVMAWVLAGLIGHLGPGQVTLRNGAISAVFVWLGFVVTTMVVNNAFGGRKPMLTAIDAGHWAGVLIVQGLVIGAFGA